jgi:guanylate kinase
MENKLNKLIDFYDLILLDSLRMFRENKKLKDEYILMDEITFEEKIQDIDDLLEYAEYNELYEECSVLADMKNQIIENNK